MSEAQFYQILDWMVPWVFRPFIIFACIVGIAYIVFLVVGSLVALYIDLRDDRRHKKGR